MAMLRDSVEYEVCAGLLGDGLVRWMSCYMQVFGGVQGVGKSGLRSGFAPGELFVIYSIC